MLLNLTHHRDMISFYISFKKMELNHEYLFLTVTRPGYGLAPKSATLPINQRYGPSYVRLFNLYQTETSQKLMNFYLRNTLYPIIKMFFWQDGYQSDGGLIHEMRRREPRETSASETIDRRSYCKFLHFDENDKKTEERKLLSWLEIRKSKMCN